MPAYYYSTYDKCWHYLVVIERKINNTQATVFTSKKGFLNDLMITIFNDC